MFKILELKSAGCGTGDRGWPRLSRRARKPLIAVKKHLKTFNVSGHNPEENYWWARDVEGLRKCWISNAD